MAETIGLILIVLGGAGGAFSLALLGYACGEYAGYQRGFRDGFNIHTPRQPPRR